MGCSWWSIGSVQVVFLMWSSSTSWKTIANTVKHQQLIISINFGISSIFKFQAYSSIDYRPAIHRDTTSCTTSSHSHTPVDCLQKTTVFFVCSFQSETFSQSGLQIQVDPIKIWWSMRILPLTVYIKVYEGVKDRFHQLVVQRLQVVVPQLQPLQRVQVVKSIVLNGCDAGGGRFLGLLSFRMASHSLVVLKPEILYVLPVTLGEKEGEDPIDCNNRVIITSRWWCSFATIMS